MSQISHEAPSEPTAQKLTLAAIVVIVLFFVAVIFGAVLSNVTKAQSRDAEFKRLYGERTEAAHATPLLVNAIRFEAGFYREHGRFADLQEGRSVTQPIEAYQKRRDELAPWGDEGFDSDISASADADDAGISFIRYLPGQDDPPVDRYGEVTTAPETDYKLDVIMGKDDDGELAHSFSCKAPSWDKTFCPRMTRVFEDLKIKQYADDDSDLDG